jgi:hypothetical protein
MTVRAISGDRVPSAFDYEVFLVLLKFKIIMTRDRSRRNSLECTSWDIAKELGLINKTAKGTYGLSKFVKDRIISSLYRLNQTFYSVEWFNELAQKSQTKTKNGDFRIIQKLENKEGPMYSIDLSLWCLNQINSSHLTMDRLNVLRKIDMVSVKRLFEVIHFLKSNKKKCKFNYDHIAWMIPINSGRKNRILINDYLLQLKHKEKVIKDFTPDFEKGKFSVEFMDNVEGSITNE